MGDTVARNEHTSGIFPHTALTCHSSSSIVAFLVFAFLLHQKKKLLYNPVLVYVVIHFFCPCCFSLREYSDAKLFFVLKSVLFCTSLYYFSFRAPLQTPTTPHTHTQPPTSHCPGAVSLCLTHHTLSCKQMLCALHAQQTTVCSTLQR